MPVPLLAAPLAGILVSVLRWLFLAKLASWVTRVLVMLGLGLATNEYLLGPMISHVKNGYAGVPSSVAIWISAFGVDQVASIMLSAYTLIGLKQVFLARSGGA